VPELPEVELARKIAAHVAVGRRIVRVVCADDRIVFEGVAPRTVKRKLEGRFVCDVVRKGKLFWLVLDTRPWPLFHLGMTGSIRVPGRTPLQLARGPKIAPPSHLRPPYQEEDEPWPPRFAKLRCSFDDGGELCFTNARRLGRIRLRHDPATEPPVSTLGFDPLLELPTLATFRTLLRRRTGTIKGILLDQGFAAGVGNWTADEVLYHARIAPHRLATSLHDTEIAAIRRALRSVISTAVRLDARSEAFPRTWLFHHRWHRKPGAKSFAGHAIAHTTVAGRTTAWCPDVQR
jgi:formamidopyrimidine-DNA glycosylase